MSEPLDTSFSNDDHLRAYASRMRAERDVLRAEVARLAAERDELELTADLLRLVGWNLLRVIRGQPGWTIDRPEVRSSIATIEAEIATIEAETATLDTPTPGGEAMQ